MEVIRLSAGDYRLLSTRFAEHGNSHRRMAGALREAGKAEDADRLAALRRMEIHFAIDLGSLCHRFQKREAEATHPLERAVLDYVAAWRERPEGGKELWVLLEHVRQVRELMEEDELVHDPES